MPDLTEAALDRMRGLLEKATSAPWWTEATKDTGRRLIKYRWNDVPTWIVESSNRPQEVTDFDLIVMLRNHADALLAAASRERATRERMEAAERYIEALGGLRQGWNDVAQAARDAWLWAKAKATGGAGEGKGR